MKIIPAIDILGGKVVRLFKGRFEDRKEYSDNPVDMAKYWQDEGAEFLHVVDLDGAKTGKPKNKKVIKDIAKNIKIPIDVGGGIRTLKDIKDYLGVGVNRVVLGTVVTKNLSFLDKEEIKSIADKIAISCDSIKAIDFDKTNFAYIKVTTGISGWIEECEIGFKELIAKMVSADIRYLNYSDRSKDGTLLGLSDGDIKSLNSCLEVLRDNNIKILYAGGIASLDDIRKLAQLKNSKLAGVIVGKALYENKFTLAEAKNVS